MGLEVWRWEGLEVGRFGGGKVGRLKVEGLKVEGLKVVNNLQSSLCENGNHSEAVVGGFDHTDVGLDLEIGFAIHGEDLVEPDDVGAFAEALAKGAHDDVTLDHGALVVVAVLDAVGGIGEDEIEFFDRHVFEAVGVVEVVGFEVGITVYGGAGQFAAVDAATEEVEGGLFIREEGLDTAQVSGRVAAVVAGLDPVVIAHDPGAIEAAVGTDEEAAGKARVGLVVRDAVV
jgi:hypothetical protein